MQDRAYGLCHAQINTFMREIFYHRLFYANTILVQKIKKNNKKIHTINCN